MASIRSGTTPAVERDRQKYWRHWTTYCKLWGVSPFLDTQSQIEANIILTAFAVRVRSGYYGRGSKLKVQGVGKALAAISSTIEMAGQPSPVYRAHQVYQRPIERLIEAMRRDDPPPVPQLAVPISVIKQSYKHLTKGATQRDTAATHLMSIAFFYLLRVGEYTKPRTVSQDGKKVRATRTVQFRVGDIGFFNGTKHIQATASNLQELLQCTAATLRISNQKNGRMGDTIHQEALKSEIHCPVKALAHRVHHILAHGGTASTLLCSFKESMKETTWTHITSGDIIKAVRKGVTLSNLYCNTNIDPELVGAHSLRAGGAMALKLTGASDTTIMKMGRWSGLTFCMYIHTQIAHLSKGLTTQMNTDMPFVNIAHFTFT